MEQFYALLSKDEVKEQVPRFMQLHFAAMIAVNRHATLMNRQNIGDNFRPRVIKRDGRELSGLGIGVTNATVTLMAPLANQNHRHWHRGCRRYRGAKIQ